MLTLYKPLPLTSLYDGELPSLYATTKTQGDGRSEETYDLIFNQSHTI